MAIKRVNMTFTEGTAAQPVLYNLGQQFGIETNIIRAEITESGGMMLVEIEGDAEDIAAGLEFAISRGVRVEDSFED